MLGSLPRALWRPLPLSRAFCMPTADFRERVGLTKIIAEVGHVKSSKELNTLVKAGMSAGYFDVGEATVKDIKARIEAFKEFNGIEVHWMSRRDSEWHTAFRDSPAAILDARNFGGESSAITSAAFDSGADYIIVNAQDAMDTANDLSKLAKEAEKEKKIDKKSGGEGVSTPLVMLSLGEAERGQEKAMQYANGFVTNQSTSEEAFKKAKDLSLPIIRELSLSPNQTHLSVQDIKLIKSTISGTDACDGLLLKRPRALEQFSAEATAEWLSDAMDAAKFSDSDAPLFWPKAPSNMVWTNPGEQNHRSPMPELEVIARATVAVTGESAAGLIVALSRSGNLADLLSKYRPGVSIVVFTDRLKASQRLSIRRGVRTITIDHKDVEALSDYERPAEALQIAKDLEWLHAGDKVVMVIAGEDIDPALTEESVSMRVVTMSDFDGPLFV